MSKKLSNNRTVTLGFVGDIAPARFIKQAYEKHSFDPIEEEVRDYFRNCDIIVANLEAPIADTSTAMSTDHMTFSGSLELLRKFHWIDVFVTANNHINDCGNDGITQTLKNVAELGATTTGVFSGKYEPYRLMCDEIDITIISFTDMLNYPFEGSDFNVLRMTDEVLMEIQKASDAGSFVVVYAHVGSLFCSFPNPLTRAFLHKCVESGAKLIVTVHSHVIGGIEEYKGVPIVHSLGDFYMDGSSQRRRTSMGVLVEINGSHARIVDHEFFSCSRVFKIMNLKEKKRRTQKWKLSYVSQVMKYCKDDKYNIIYRLLYKIEILSHIMSTVKFLLNERSISGFFKLIIARREEARRLFFWMLFDRSKLTRDDDALQKSKVHNINDV
jgi:poly-gamma-glutamate capsule biosynthesis protein CapA/YwtB (metallophosphatase superfamily)